MSVVNHCTFYSLMFYYIQILYCLNVGLSKLLIKLNWVTDLYGLCEIPKSIFQFNNTSVFVFYVL